MQGNALKEDVDSSLFCRFSECPEGQGQGRGHQTIEPYSNPRSGSLYLCACRENALPFFSLSVRAPFSLWNSFLPISFLRLGEFNLSEGRESFFYGCAMCWQLFLLFQNHCSSFFSILVPSASPRETVCGLSWRQECVLGIRILVLFPNYTFRSAFFPII